MFKQVKRLHRQYKDYRVFRALLARPLSDYELIATPAKHDGHVASAQKLHASVYLFRGFVKEGDIASDGRLTLTADPHQLHSEYFVAVTSADPDTVRALVRQIRVAPSKGIKSFPIINNAKISIAERKKISEYPLEKCVEISALAKAKGESSILPLLLYRSMLVSSLEKGDEIWLMACDVRLYQRLKLLFGDAITQIGNQTHYYGGDIIPAKLVLTDIVPSLKKISESKSIKSFGLRRAAAKFILSAYNSAN